MHYRAVFYFIVFSFTNMGRCTLTLCVKSRAYFASHYVSRIVQVHVLMYSYSRTFLSSLLRIKKRKYSTVLNGNYNTGDVVQ